MSEGAPGSPRSLDEAAKWVEDTLAERERVLDSVARGESSAQAVLRSAKWSPAVETLKLLPLLEAEPGRGKVKTRRALAGLNIGLDVVLKDLREEQIADVVALEA